MGVSRITDVVQIATLLNAIASREPGAEQTINIRGFLGFREELLIELGMAALVREGLERTAGR